MILLYTLHAMGADTLFAPVIFGTFIGMKEMGELNGAGSTTDAWAKEVLAQIESEYDGLLEKESGWADQIVMKNLGPLRDQVEEAIRNICAQNDMTEATKKTSIEEALVSYEKRKGALLTQMK